jgi:hypothetical protein
MGWQWGKLSQQFLFDLRGVLGQPGGLQSMNCLGWPPERGQPFSLSNVPFVDLDLDVGLLAWLPGLFGIGSLHRFRPQATPLAQPPPNQETFREVVGLLWSLPTAKLSEHAFGEHEKVDPRCPGGSVFRAVHPSRGKGVPRIRP